jgi:hypothetical protein
MGSVALWRGAPSQFGSSMIGLFDIEKAVASLFRFNSKVMRL